MIDKPIFLDVTGRRATRISLIGWIAAVVSTALGIGFVISLFAVPQLQHVRLPGELSVIHTQELENKATAPGLVPTATQLAREARLRTKELAQKRKLWVERNSRARALAAAMNPHPGRPLSIAFFPNWEASAYELAQSRPAPARLDNADLAQPARTRPRAEGQLRQTRLHADPS